jgi:CelD/BcsL family acetyltransferase involved in cellulose biosynthesis
MDMTWPQAVLKRQASAGRQVGFNLTAENISIALTRDLTTLERDWLSFQEIAAGTFFQTFEWCRAWLDTVGRASKAEPVIVSGRYETGELAFLLPFCSRRSGGLNIIEWIATGQSGYGYGLFDPNFLPGAREWFASRGWAVIEKLKPADVLHLRDMPEDFHGFPHPLGGWFSFAGANSSYTMKLEKNFDALYAKKRSPASRRGNRKRDAKLFTREHAIFGLPASPAETHQLLDAMFDHQQHRLSENGVSRLFGEPEKALIHRLADLPSNRAPSLLPYHLQTDGQLSAMMLGGYYAGAYWALISSLAPGNLRKYSPGDAALRRTIQACCENGLTAFDFSSGDMPYKWQWADKSIRLHETVRVLSWRGFAWALAKTLGLLAKRLIKRSPPLWAAAVTIRKQLRVFRR